MATLEVAEPDQSSRATGLLRDDVVEDSFSIAKAVVSELNRLGLGRAIPEHSIADLVGRAMWFPEYSA